MAGAWRAAREREEFTPHWPDRAAALRDAPNIVIILMDDLGRPGIGCVGGEIEIPHIDALAARGLRFAHYATHPIGSPARAALLTGMKARAAAAGWLSNNDAGYPGYRGEIPQDCATLAELLRAGGGDRSASHPDRPGL